MGGINITQNISSNRFLNKEIAGKYSADQQSVLNNSFDQKRKQRSESFGKISEEKLEKELQKQNNTQNIPIIKKIGESGRIVEEHKDRLALIFIGDSQKSVDEKNSSINAPKLSMIVGGGLESSVNPKTGQPFVLDLTRDEIIPASSQLHLISLTDIDVKGILPVSSLKNRSAIKAEADILELSAKEIVLIRSLGRPYNSKGARVFTPGGVHIISGINTNKQKIREPEPMVLGKGLSDALLQIVDQINQINSTLLNVTNDLLSLKVSLLAHEHIVSPAALAAPSLTLASSVGPTIASDTILNLTNIYTNILNVEILKTNNLLALSPNKFLSDYNRVN